MSFLSESSVRPTSVSRIIELLWHRLTGHLLHVMNWCGSAPWQTGSIESYTSSTDQNTVGRSFGAAALPRPPVKGVPHCLRSGSQRAWQCSSESPMRRVHSDAIQSAKFKDLPLLVDRLFRGRKFSVSHCRWAFAGKLRHRREVKFSVFPGAVSIAPLSPTSERSRPHNPARGDQLACAVNSTGCPVVGVRSDRAVPAISRPTPSKRLRPSGLLFPTAQVAPDKHRLVGL